MKLPIPRKLSFLAISAREAQNVAASAGNSLFGARWARAVGTLCAQKIDLK